MHGAPDIARVALFMAGEVAGYSLFGTIARRRAPDAAHDHDDPSRIVGGTLNWFGVALAVASAWAASELPAAAAWALGPAPATIVYLSAAAVQLVVAETRYARRATDEPSALLGCGG